jgi:hypothetical protein
MIGHLFLNLLVLILNVFEVVGDKVRMSKWQSSKRLDNGDRDLFGCIRIEPLLLAEKHRT